ncbi:RCC1 domain-containing protein, partial [Gemmatimonadota bacterium]
GSLGADMGTAGNSSVPVAVAGGIQFVFLEAGLGGTCGVTAAGAVYCWGKGELVGSEEDSPVPILVSTTPAFQTVSVGFQSACGRTASGEGYCWGRDGGDFGNDAPHGTHATPVRAGNNMIFSVFRNGSLHGCGITPDGSAYCWGYDGGAGKLGLGMPMKSVQQLPAPVVGGHRFASLDVNNGNNVTGHTCALTPSGAAYCWGTNYRGELGGPSAEICSLSANPPWDAYECSSSPVAVQGGLFFRSIASGNSGGFETGGGHTCAVTPDGEIYCWGGNGSGQLGDGSMADSHTPVRISLPGG